MSRTLPLTLRAKIFALLDAGFTIKQVAKRVGVSRSAVWKLEERRKSEGEEVALKGKKSDCGRPRKVQDEDKQWLVRAVTKDPFLSGAQLKKKANGALDHLSVRRVQETLNKAGLKSHIAAQKPLLTDKMREKRIKWCQDHLGWTVDDWKSVLFSDESTFYQIRNVRKTVRRPSGERFNPQFTKKTVKHPASVMVWGCFSAFGRGRLSFLEKGATMNTPRYIAVLEEKMLPEFRARRLDWFLQDGAPCHKSKGTMSFLEQNGVSVMDWPGNSPDLNPIENLWEVMKKIVEEKEPKSLPDLIQKIKEVWVKETSQEVCLNLVESMPKRVQMVLDYDGWSIPY